MTKQQKQMNVESFNLDHTKVKAPYVRLASKNEGEHGDVLYKYDLRFLQPNKEHMRMPALHSLEHLMAELIRNHSDQVIDISPMGFLTVFYVTKIKYETYVDVVQLLEKTLIDVLEANEVPGCNEVQCGWVKSHSLEGAKEIAKNILAKKDEWTEVFA